MIIDDIFLDSLLEKATESERRRVNYDLRTTADDQSQRILNVLLPGTQVPIHRHQDSTETIFVVVAVSPKSSTMKKAWSVRDMIFVLLKGVLACKFQRACGIPLL